MFSLSQHPSYLGLSSESDRSDLDLSLREERWPRSGDLGRTLRGGLSLRCLGGDRGGPRLESRGEGLRRGGDSSDSNEYRLPLVLPRPLPLGLAGEGDREGNRPLRGGDMSLPDGAPFRDPRGGDGRLGVTLRLSREYDRILLGGDLDLLLSEPESDTLPLLSLDPEL